MGIPLLRQDLANHAIWGAIIATAAVFVVSPIIAAGLAALVGVGKEVYDKVSKNGTPDILDAVVTAVGGVVAVLPQLITMVK